VAGTGGTLAASFASDVAALGGTVTSTIPEVGIAVVQLARADAREALGKLKGVSNVAADVVRQWQDPNPRVEAVELGDEGVVATGFGDTETFRQAQWAPDAVSAPAAWNAGYRGAGARVAILDGGIHSAHIDIAPNLDAARSASFVPGFAFNQDVGTFWHGTHVAGIVAAAGQGLGTVGIAPSATIIGVKVLHNGSGAFSWMLNGMIYAARPIAEGGAGANIINLSLGAGFDKQGKDAAQLVNIIGRVAMYARQRGVLVVAAAGNSGYDLDHTDNLVFVPAQAPGVVSVAATGPLGFGLGATNFDRPASYTNYGQSAISFAGPGGDFALPGSALCSKPRNPVGTVTTLCYVFDMVMAPCRGSTASISTYCFAAGTSMASPAVAGVAALVVGKNGPMQPAQLEAILRASADDLGKPGNDDFYGAGRVNAWRAVQ
ncbi:MAG TPA: S8 family serine peptidase, partial [Gemmatimonadaceae bacterium]|nr:S8 family serine peptidase [Gemmatimonadaceae bacterium]